MFLLFSDDPYYCGLRARIPNFAKTKAQKDKESARYAAAAMAQQSQPVPPGGPGGALPPCTIGMPSLSFSSVFPSTVLTRKLALDDRDAALLHRHPTPQGAAPGGEGGEGGEEEEKRCNGDPLVINDPHDALPTFSLLML